MKRVATADALALLKAPQIANGVYIYYCFTIHFRDPDDKIELIAAQPSNEARVKTLRAYFRVYWYVLDRYNHQLQTTAINPDSYNFKT